MRFRLMLAGMLGLMLLALPLALLAQDDPAPETLRIMDFNVWVGGELVDFDKVVEAIETADADIVLLQEIGGNTQRLADALGWSHYSERMHIVSRLPLIDPPGADGRYIFAQVRPGEVFALVNTHLPSDPYGPYLVRDGESLEAVLANEEETRMPALRPFLDVISGLLADGYPVVYTGDFNTPSHLDWTEAAVGSADYIRYAVPWPVTAAIEDAGLVDTYRAIHPDPLQDWGMTWTPGYPVPRLRPDEVQDRIDYIFASPDITILDSQIVGERGGEDVGIGIEPWPSDHRAMLTTVSVTPAAPPLFTSLEHRVLRVGDPIVVRYSAPGGEAEDRIVLVPAGDAPEAALMSLPPMEADYYGAVTFGSDTLRPGPYDAVLIDGAGQERARNTFWLLSRFARPEIRTTQPNFAEGEAISVEWENAPGNRFDWIGVYSAGDADLYNYWAYAYVDQQSSGALSIDDAGLPPGDYEVRLMRDDWYVVLASAPFTVGE